MLDLLVLADHVNNTHKNTMIPKTSEILPAPIIIFLFLFSSSVNSDQGFCFLPIAIPIVIPIAMPIGMPITKSLIFKHLLYQ